MDGLYSEAKACAEDARRYCVSIVRLANPKNSDKSDELAAAIALLGLTVGRLAGLVDLLADKLDQLKREEFRDGHVR